MAANPAQKASLSSEKAKRPRYLTKDQVERLVDVTPERYRALVLVVAFGGLRWVRPSG